MATQHHIKKYLTSVQEDGKPITVYCLSCPPCGVYGKAFKTRSAQEKEAAQQHS